MDGPRARAWRVPNPSLLALPGLERVRAAIGGQAPDPPIHHLFGLRPVTGPAAATFAVPASSWLCSDASVYRSGVAALVADAALAVSIQVELGPGAVVATSDLSFNFLRPASPGSGLPAPRTPARCRYLGQAVDAHRHARQAT